MKPKSPEDRKEQRTLHSLPIFKELEQLVMDSKPKVPTRSGLGKALEYADSQLKFIAEIFNDGKLEIDNNGIENKIRPFALGRKNWLFSASIKGVHASANIYSILQTAKANGIEPYAYLKDVFTKLPQAQSVDDYEALLPLRRL